MECPECGHARSAGQARCGHCEPVFAKYGT